MSPIDDPAVLDVTSGVGTFRTSAAGPADGPLVVLLHGFPQTRHAWRHVLSRLASHGFHCVAPDQRGYSPGARPAAVEAYAVGNLVHDVLDLADALGADRFHLVGHDWGGQVAWLTAARHPHRVRSLSVLSRPHPAAFAEAWDLDPDQEARSGHHAAFEDPSMTDALLRDGCAGLRAGLTAAGVAPGDADAYCRRCAIASRSTPPSTGTAPRPRRVCATLAARTSSSRRCISGATRTPRWDAEWINAQIWNVDGGR